MSIREKIRKLEALINDPAATEGEKAAARTLIKRLKSRRKTREPEARVEGRRITIDFGNPPATPRQKEYMEVICKYFGLTMPEDPTYDEACEFLNKWSPGFRAEMFTRAQVRHFWRVHFGMEDDDEWIW